MTESHLDVRSVFCLGSNYVYLIRDNQTGTTGVVDPAESAPVQAELDRLGWRLDHILLTHHHADHVDGVPDLRGPGVTVIGAAADRRRLPRLDVELNVGDRWSFGSRPIQIMDVSGHTLNHIALYFDEDKVVFCGDCMFVMGCGRVFEGTALQMWESLSRLAALPGDTRAYCGHELTEGNAAFCLSVDPDHAPTAARAREIRAQLARGEPTVPTTVRQERETNIFLRAAEPHVAKTVGLAEADPAAVFAELRRRKDGA